MSRPCIPKNTADALRQQSKHDMVILSAPVFIKQNQMRNQNSGRPGPSRPMSSLGSLALGARSSEFLK
jgi:hypothetical protein